MNSRGAARAAGTMLIACLFIAVSTLLAKGVAGRFETVSQPQDAIHPLQITAGRFLFGWLVWLAVVCFRRTRLRAIHWRLHIARSFAGWLTVTSLFWAGSLMALADATAISFLSPLVVMVLAVLFLGERVGWLRISAAAIMLSGALVLVRPGTGAFQPAALIALISAFAGGVESTLIKRLSALEPRVQVLFINNSIGLLIALVAAFWVWRDPSIIQWLLLAAVGISMAAAQVFFLTSMRDGEASFVMPFLYSTLVFASLLDYWVFGDAPDALGAVGALIIVAGAVFLALRERAREGRLAKTGQ